MLYLNEKQWDKKEWMVELSKHFDVKANKKKEFAFHLTDHYRGVKYVDNKAVPTYPESLNYPMRYAMRMNGEDVQLRYAVNPSLVKPAKGGGTTTVDDADRIIFNNGVFRVKADQLDLYLFMLLAPNNYTNPYYFNYEKRKGQPDLMVRNDEAVPTGVQMMFKEKNAELEQADAFDQARAKYTAENHIFSVLTEGECRELYKNYGEHDYAESTLKRIKNFLLGKASENPTLFMENVNSDVRTIKTKVVEAINAELIVFDSKSSWWKWTGPKGERIIQVARGQDNILALVRYINEKDDGSLLAALEEKVIAAEKEMAE